MKFIYIDKAGNQVGPVDETEIERRILAGDIVAATAIRSALLRDFRIVSDFDCFTAALKQVRPAAEEREDYGAIGLMRRAGQQEESSGSVYSHTPGDAGIGRRLLAGFFDFLVLALVGGILIFFASRSLISDGDLVNLEPPKNSAPPAAARSAAPVGTAAAAAVRTDAPRSRGVYGASDTPAGRAARMAAPKLTEIERLNEERSRQAGEIADWTENRNPPREQPETAAPPAPVPSSAAPVPETEAESAAAPEPETSPYASITVADGHIIFPISGTRYLKIEESAYRATMGRVLLAVLVLTLLYYSLTLAIFAQTFGMWFWGIFLTRSRVAEVYFLRAFIYALLLPLFGILMIPSVLVSKRSVADWLCGVRQIRVGSASGR